MLIVYGLSAFIAMLVAWIIKLVFAGIRRQRVATAAQPDAAVNAAPKPASGAAGKAA